MFRHALLCGAVCLLLPSSVGAETGTAPGSRQANDYTLTVRSRLVIEDITVTDSKGNPVSGLPRSAFHVFDNMLPQQALDFAEVSGNAVPSPSPQVTNLYTNASLYRNQGTLVAILIDPASITLEDQMYLRLQALRFVQSASEDTSIAVFRANNQGVPVLLQPPTNDKQLLQTAISASVPVVVRPTHSGFRNAVAELNNVSDYLKAVPGRKAVLWLAGAFPLYEPPEYTTFCAHAGSDGGACKSTNLAEEDNEMRGAYRSLEQARIAVYPIDVRGVLMGGIVQTPVINTKAAAEDPSSIPPRRASESEKVAGQYDEMDRLAEATGGRAFYSNNAVSTLMASAVHLATRGYSLSYRPTDYNPDGKWHTVKITVNGPYTVRYRTGYYADASPNQKPGERKLLDAGASTEPVQREIHGARKQADAAESPIIFSAHIVSAGKQGKDTLVKIRYVIPTDQLAFGASGESGHARFRLAALAYNTWGDVLNHSMDVIETRYSPEQMKVAERIGTPADQQLQIAKGAQFVLLAVEDLRSGKIGTLQLPLSTVQAEAAPGAAKTTP